MNITSALRHLEHRPAPAPGASGSSAGLAALLHVLGDPHLAAPVVLVTGTRGSASVARAAAELLRAQGLSVGLWTSSHLEQVNEQIVWDGAAVDDDTLGTLVGDVAAVEDLADVTLTASEVLAGAAFRWFAEVAADVVVAEAGAADAAAVAGVVAAAVEAHTAPAEVVAPEGTWVGDTDFGVAVDRVAVGGRLLDLRTPGGAHDEVYVPVHGSHHAASASLALAAVEAFLGRPQPHDVVAEAFGGLALPGAFEIVARHPTVVLDVVEDADAAAATSATVADDLTLAGSVLLVVGLRAGADPSAVLAALGAASAGLVVTCAPEGAGAVAASDLVGVAERLGAVAETVPEPIDAVHRALAVATEDDLVLVAGAPQVVGPVRAALREMEVSA